MNIFGAKACPSRGKLMSAVLTLAMPVVLVSVSLAAGASPDSLHRQVDARIEAKFASFEIDPATAVAEKSSDAEFVRRIYLDLTGSIPDARTASRFQLDRDPDKRTKLIDQLLVSDEFPAHMAAVFDVMLMERRADSRVTTGEWRTYLQKSFAADKPLDQLAREILGGGSATDDTLLPAAKFYLDRAVDKDALVRDTGRLFLGMDLQCAQCHDHPTIDDWKHQHYFGLSVFFGGSKQFKRADGKFVLQEAYVPSAEFASVFEPDITHSTGPQIPFGKALMVPTFEEGEEYVDKDWKKKKLIPELKFSLRDLLAKEITTDSSPTFARNFANRLWGMMMGRGLVHPYDMDHSENPPSHPELLDVLGRSLAEMKYDTRSFLRELALSGTYQRSSGAPLGVDPDTVPPESFAIANMKGLSPEQLFASLLTATSSDEVFQHQIESLLRQDAETYEELMADGEKMAKARTGERTRRVTEFVGTFASTAGRPEGEFQASLPQALFLANHDALVEWLEPKSGNLANWLLARDDPHLIAEDAYLAILSRAPNADEIAAVTAHLEARGDDRPAAVTELLWSLVASAEFRLNH